MLDTNQTYAKAVPINNHKLIMSITVLPINHIFYNNKITESWNACAQREKERWKRNRPV